MAITVDTITAQVWKESARTLVAGVPAAATTLEEQYAAAIWAAAARTLAVDESGRPLAVAEISPAKIPFIIPNDEDDGLFLTFTVSDVPHDDDSIHVILSSVALGDSDLTHFLFADTGFGDSFDDGIQHIDTNGLDAEQIAARIWFHMAALWSDYAIADLPSSGIVTVACKPGVFIKIYSVVNVHHVTLAIS